MNYYVCYVYSKSGTIGFGSMLATYSFEISTLGTIESLSKKILIDHDYDSVVIINFIKLKAL
jgi:hypothetical protein